MTLSSYNVNQQLINKINQFLLPSPPFSSLKSHLINKQPITEIHQQLVQEINDLEESDKKNAKAAQIRQITEQQISLDAREKERDEREEYQQNAKKTELQTELAFITANALQINRSIAELQRVLATRSHTHTIPSTPPPHVHTHISTAPQVHTSRSATPPVHTHQHQYDPDVEKMNQLQWQAQAIVLRMGAINNLLGQIQQKNQQLQLNRKERDARLQFRLDLAQQKPGVTVYDTLSLSNAALLRKNIACDHEQLKSKRHSLISEATQKNHQLYMQQLELSLNDLNISALEIKALRQVIGLMKEHFKHVNAANGIQSDLNRTNETISTLRSKLHQWNAKVKELEQASPHFIQHNETLIIKNKELALTEQKNKKSRDKLITPTWALAAVALLTSIPLFLALGGFLPVFAAPIVLYTIVSILPTLSLLASVGTGIAALVFAIKGRINQNEMDANQKTIRKNQEQMGKNDIERLQLQQQTIPTCMNSIEEHSQKKINIEKVLKSTKELAEQSLEQAKLSEPTQYELLYPELAQDIKVPPYNDMPPRYNFFKQEGTEVPPPAYTDAHAPSAPGGL